MPSIWSVIGSSSLTKTLKPVLAVLHSLGIRIVFYIDDMLLLHQQSKVLQKMFAQVVAFLEKLGFLVKIEKCSVAPSQCIVFLGAKLDSTTMTVKTKHYFGYLPSSPSSGLCPNENSVHSYWTYEPCFSNRDHDGPSSLPRSPAFTPTNSGSAWSWEQSVHPLELSGPGRPEVVGLRERTSEWLSSSATPYRCHHLERCVQKGLGCSVPRDIYRRPLECGGSESTHQCLGITSSNLSSKSFTETSATGAQTCPLTFTQYNSSGIYQQAGGHTHPCSDHSGTRTVGSSPGSSCIRDSSAYSRDSEWSSRHSLQGARQRNRVDSGQTDLPVNLSEVLHTGSGPLCLPPDSSSPQVCLKVPGSWGSSRGCLSPGLEQMVLSNPPSCSPSSSYP